MARARGSGQKRWPSRRRTGGRLLWVEKPDHIGDLFAALPGANNNRWGGAPDAVARFADGRVAMRDGKPAAKDFSAEESG